MPPVPDQVLPRPPCVRPLLPGPVVPAPRTCELTDDNTCLRHCLSSVIGLALASFVEVPGRPSSPPDQPSAAARPAASSPARSSSSADRSPRRSPPLPLNGRDAPTVSALPTVPTFANAAVGRPRRHPRRQRGRHLLRARTLAAVPRHLPLAAPAHPIPATRANRRGSPAVAVARPFRVSILGDNRGRMLDTHAVARPAHPTPSSPETAGSTAGRHQTLKRIAARPHSVTTSRRARPSTHSSTRRGRPMPGLLYARPTVAFRPSARAISEIMNMPIDFSDMFDDDDELPLHPRDIFFTLNRDPSFSFPRDIQTEVMNRWFDRRDKPDNVIKLNVGSGKTLVGLLLLQSSLNERKGPALYVSPNTQLSQQVMQEAQALGIEVTTDPRDADYAAGDKICVVNVYKLFNGKSVFGVGTSRIDVGTVVIDDAHACVSTITKQFRIKLPNTHEAYQNIVATLSGDLRDYNEARFLDIEAGDPHAHMEVPFWSWDSHHTQILRALHEHRGGDELQFT